MKRRYLVLLAMVASACGDQPLETRLPVVQDAKPATVLPAGYVELPAGAYHQSCVFEVGNGDRVDREGNVTRAGGGSYKLPQCHYPALNSRIRGRRSTNGDVFSTHSTQWREAIEGIAIAGRTIRRITAEWVVPALPIPGHNDGHWWATFPGIENPDPGYMDPNTYILQPVLEYKNGSWRLFSMRCNDGSNCVGSPIVYVQPGDTILGVVDTPWGCNGLFCDFMIVTKDYRTGQQTTLIVEHEFDNYTRIIGGSVEVNAALTSCVDYPQPGVTYTSIRVWDNYGQITPFWNTYYAYPPPSCNMNIQYSTGLVSTAVFQHTPVYTPPATYLYVTGDHDLENGQGGAWVANLSDNTSPNNCTWSVDGTPVESGSCTLYRTFSDGPSYHTIDATGYGADGTPYSSGYPGLSVTIHNGNGGGDTRRSKKRP